MNKNVLIIDAQDSSRQILEALFPCELLSVESVRSTGEIKDGTARGFDFIVCDPFSLGRPYENVVGELRLKFINTPLVVLASVSLDEKNTSVFKKLGVSYFFPKDAFLKPLRDHDAVPSRFD